MTVDISRATADELRAIAERGAVELDGAGAQELLQWTEDTFGDSYIVASNMQDGVLVHLAAQVHPGVDVLFLDTGYHFPKPSARVTRSSRCTASTSSTLVRWQASPSRMSPRARICSPVIPTAAAHYAKSRRSSRHCPGTARG